MCIYIQINYYRSNHILQAVFVRTNRQGSASYAENVKRSSPIHPYDKIKMSKKDHIQSLEEERMIKAVRELNSGWKKSGSITQNLRYDSDNEQAGTF